MSSKSKLLIWEIVCIVWIVLAGSLLHFAFELSEYWKPMALIAAVNESVWEHIKMYFWPGLFFALAQYTYSRGYHHNYWIGKAAAMAVTPLVIIISYESYMAWSLSTGIKPSLAIMLSIMLIGISAGQLTSYKILSAEPFATPRPKLAPALMATLILMFSTFTFFPPKVFLFENFACYTYTGEYGILEDYEPYRIFTREGEEGIGVNYCANIKSMNLAKALKDSL